MTAPSNLIPGWPTYSAGATLNPGVSPTDAVGIENTSATVIVIVHRFRVTLQMAAGAIGLAIFPKRTALSTGGTSSTVTPAKMVTTNPAAAATIRIWTAAATGIGALQGNAAALAGDVASSTDVDSTIDTEWGAVPWEQPLTLVQNEALYLNTASGADPVRIRFWIEWSELKL